jgi:glc operon protein GlcG
VRRSIIARALSTRSIARLFVVLLTVAAAHAQEPKTDGRATSSDVRDAAAMFGGTATRRAEDELADIERSSSIATLIETVRSVDDEPAAVAARKAKEWGGLGLYILIDRQDRKLEIAPTPGLSGRLGELDVQPIRAAFLTGFRAGDFDEGLTRGVAAIRTFAANVADAAKAHRGSGASSSAVVLRNQVKLTLSGARLIIAGAEARAAEMGLKVNIAVVDDGGHLLTFDRMDGARPASGYTAMTKATTAATFRQETGPLPKGAATPDPLLNLSLQNAAAASGGKLTTLFGGVPILVDGQVIGGVGVGGGTGEQDAAVAKAGIARLQAALQAPSPPSDEPSAPDAAARPGSPR